MPWDAPQTSFVVNIAYKYYYDVGLDGNKYYRTYKVGFSVSGNTSDVRYMTVGYKITGNRYNYPACINTTTPVMVESGYTKAINCNANYPVAGSLYSTNQLWETGAIGGGYARGFWGFGVQYTDGTKFTSTIAGTSPYDNDIYV